MSVSRQDVSSFVLSRLRESPEAIFDDAPSEDSYLFNSVSFQSLVIVVLATEIQEHYRTVIPFNDLFAEVNSREGRDLTVREWVDFVHRHLETGASWIPERQELTPSSQTKRP